MTSKSRRCYNVNTRLERQRRKDNVATTSVFGRSNDVGNRMFWQRCDNVIRRRDQKTTKTQRCYNVACQPGNSFQCKLPFKRSFDDLGAIFLPCWFDWNTTCFLVDSWMNICTSNIFTQGYLKMSGQKQPIWEARWKSEYTKTEPAQSYIWKMLQSLIHCKVFPLRYL